MDDVTPLDLDQWRDSDMCICEMPWGGVPAGRSECPVHRDINTKVQNPGFWCAGVNGPLCPGGAFMGGIATVSWNKCIGKELIKEYDIAKLTLEPGEYLIVKMKKYRNLEHVNATEIYFKRRFPNNMVILLPYFIDIEKLVIKEKNGEQT